MCMQTQRRLLLSYFLQCSHLESAEYQRLFIEYESIAAKRVILFFLIKYSNSASSVLKSWKAWLPTAEIYVVLGFYLHFLIQNKGEQQTVFPHKKGSLKQEVFLSRVFGPKVNAKSCLKYILSHIHSNNIKANEDMKRFTLGLIVTNLNLGELDGIHISPM